MEKAVHKAGKRKKSVARATLYPGSGRIRINSKLIDFYQPEMAKLRIQEPLILAGDVSKKVDIDVKVFGGGWSSQADAVRLAIARALVDYTKSADLEKRYLAYDRGLLVADTRRKEQKKPNTHSNARSRRQKSYR